MVDHVKSTHKRWQGFWLQERPELVGDKAIVCLFLFLFFKTQSTGFSFAVIHLRLQWRNGGADWSCQKIGRVGKHRSGKEVTWRLALSHTPLPAKPKRPFFLRGAGPSQKPQMRKRTIPHPKGYSLPHLINPACHTQHLHPWRGDSSRGQG